MAGTKEGSKKSVKTNKERYGEDFYKKIGVKSGVAYRERQKLGIAKPRGFAAVSKAKRVAAGKKGGKKSKRVKHEQAK